MGLNAFHHWTSVTAISRGLKLKIPFLYVKGDHDNYA